MGLGYLCSMELLMTKICMTKDIGVHGNLFGGNMLTWVDEAAASLAYRVCRTPNMVTRKMTEILFERPVKVGNIINIYGEVIEMGTTSVSLAIDARRFNVYTEEEVTVCRTDVVFVRIDEAGQKIPIDAGIRQEWQRILADKAVSIPR